MPRNQRQASFTGIYHVGISSINHQQIFEDPQDFQIFIQILCDCSEKYEFYVYAYCLMSNHVHLVIDIPFSLLSIFMQSFSSRFVRWYNKKYDRSGHLFQSRFWSVPIETSNHLLNSIVYIHENPVKAKMCHHATDYPWSSCQAYYGKGSAFLYFDRIISIFGSLEEFTKQSNQVDTDSLDPNLFEPPYKEKPVIEDQAHSLFHSITGCRSSSDFQKLPTEQRDQYIIALKSNHLTQNQISRFGGVSRRTICRVLKKNKHSK